ncbi:hypothetical protein PSN45_005307 [Yamadazyma tenuis]|uniref:Uncharacterized protein n=1 Tax=Candida tenuis (strain ATCC 10573 / BCRC 21748 / CBS 615 / JCM 9827 / NBRC 10315 / NRRL Y-1498 / VKM Y-70) TaxID=590646 RepID=G3B1E4_CANTC|nr:uncharacterized protein CANTEDRAFT_93186 [Yamadazyma tenuis ATCC 10573]EGV64952.1 hypothetical protein CANTEDRAFT_93186 [Yamadazyma tenuis ATCC 10573]WEJ97748.1 hypothetical protein PSN45_005307 [Yamadazyma tenuis]
MNKRKIDYSSTCKKKNIDEATQKLYSSSNEWPIYNHPDGGIIKITPWGSIRQFEINGEVITKFEDMAFNDYNFAGTNITSSPNGIANTGNSTAATAIHSGDVSNASEFQELPQTPQSIQSVRLSPYDETEQYVVKGYEDDMDQYSREPEHYLGMGDDEYGDMSM